MKTLSERQLRILHGIYPSVLLPLIRAGHLDRSHLDDLQSTYSVIAKRLRFATNRMKWNVALEAEFAQRATCAWRDRRREEAIVLLAVALEQCLNGCLRLIVEARGFRSTYVTDQLRCINIEAKLGWFFEMYSRRRFPRKLGSRARKLFDIRNSIVHYKAVFAHPDAGEDSHTKIQKEINALGRFRPHTFFDRFHEFCWETVGRCDPAIKLAVELREKLIPTSKVR